MSGVSVCFFLVICQKWVFSPDASFPAFRVWSSTRRVWREWRPRFSNSRQVLGGRSFLFSLKGNDRPKCCQVRWTMLVCTVPRSLECRSFRRRQKRGGHDACAKEEKYSALWWSLWQLASSIVDPFLHWPRAQGELTTRERGWCKIAFFLDFDSSLEFL